LSPWPALYNIDGGSLNVPSFTFVIVKNWRSSVLFEGSATSTVLRITVRTKAL